MTAETNLPWASHQLTLADWEALPEYEQFRLELVEGLLSIMPNPRPWHQRASLRLTQWVDEHLWPQRSSPTARARSTGS